MRKRLCVQLVIVSIIICTTLTGGMIIPRGAWAKNSQPIEWLKLKVGDLQLPTQIGSLKTQHEPFFRKILRPQFTAVVSEISLRYEYLEFRTKASIHIIMPTTRANIGWGRKYFQSRKEKWLEVARSDRYKELEAYDGGDSFAVEYTFLKNPDSKWRSRHIGKLNDDFAYLINAEGHEGKVDHALAEAETAAEKALKILQKALKDKTNPGTTQVGSYNLKLGELGFPGIAGEWVFGDIAFMKTDVEHIAGVRVTYDNSWAKGTLYVNLFFPDDWGSRRINKDEGVKLAYTKFYDKIVERMRSQPVKIIQEKPNRRIGPYEFEFEYNDPEIGMRNVLEQGDLKRIRSFHLSSTVKQGTAVPGHSSLAKIALEALQRILDAKKPPLKSGFQNVIGGDFRNGAPNSNRTLPQSDEGWKSIVD